MPIPTALKNKIPCFELNQQHKKIKKEIFEAFEKVYDLNTFSNGIFVAEFETEFAKFCHTKYAVGVNNGTSALHLSLLALNIGLGDEVILPANSFISTAWAVTYTGAAPKFADCTQDTWQICTKSVEEKITSRTKAIVGVHLYGQPCDIVSLKEICKRHKLYFLEDATQAHGAKYKNAPVGGFGETAAFCFYPSKNLGACGDGGAITTDNKQFYKRLISLRNDGSVLKYYHDEIGFNMRMGDMEAASLTIKLQYLEGWNNRRKEIAKKYRDGISNLKIRLQFQPSWADSVFHLFVITTEDRDGLMGVLNKHDIYPGLHYPIPCHMQKPFRDLNYGLGDCPNAEYLAAHCLSLPMYAELKNNEVDYVIDVLNRY